MRLRLCVLPGDGIGPEVTAAALGVLQSIADVHGHSISIVERPIGADAIERTGEPLPVETLEACLASDAVLLGAVGAPGFDTVARERRPEAGLLALREACGAFANLRPARWYDATADCSPLRPAVASGADVMFVRELLSGLYFGTPRGIGYDNGELRAVNTMRYSASEVARVAHIAFTCARARRGHVTSVDKANVLEASQLWRETVTHVAGEYPDVQLEHRYVDAFAMMLVTDPRHFDVIVTENLFGDILSDEAAAITGSLGMLPSASIGGRVDIYEPVHGSAPNLAGHDVANPLGAIASIAMMLRHTARLEREAADVESAINAVLDAGYRTIDISRGDGRTVSTSHMGHLVAEAVVELSEMRHPFHAV